MRRTQLPSLAERFGAPEDDADVPLTAHGPPVPPREKKTKPAETPFVPGSLNAVNWQAQGKAGLEGAGTGAKPTGRFRSAAIACEVKLAEALSNARLAQKPAADQQAGEEQQPAKPDALRTAVSMQVLTELCELSGPFSAVLARLRHELVASIYSPYYDAAEGSMMYTQTPFFVVVDRLEREKTALQSEQQQLREEMLERLDTVAAIEERMALLETGVSAERARNEELVAEADGIAEQLERALAEGSLCKQELKRLREEYGVMQEDLVRLQRGNAGAELEEFNRLKAANAEMEVQLEHMGKELAALQSENMQLISLDAHEALQAELTEALEQVNVMREMMGDAANVTTDGGAAVPLTPRPDFASLHFRDLPVDTTSTRDIVRALRDRMRTYEYWADDEPAPSHAYKEAVFLLAPDPPPASVNYQPLYTVVDNLPRAEDVDADAELSFDPATGTTLAALGTGASVPRFLRGANVVPITVWSKSHTISTVRRLLQSKAAEDGERGAWRPMPEFIYDWLRRTHTAHADVVAAGSSLVMSLRCFSFHPEVKLALKLLCGELPEAVYVDRVRMEQSLRELWTAVDVQACGGGAPTGLISMESALKALAGFLPNKSQPMQEELERALHASVGGSDVEDVPYGDLFSDDAELSQLLLCLRAQHLTEIVDYVTLVTDTLSGLTRANGMTLTDADDVGSAALPLSVLCKAICATDERKAPAEVDLLLARGMRVGELSDVAVAMARDTPVELNVFVAQLRTGLLKRSGNYDALAVNQYRPKGAVEGSSSVLKQPPVA